jgi:transposase-like protein
MTGPGGAEWACSMHHQRATTGVKADGCRRLEVSTGIGRRRRWSLEEKARIVAESLAPATTAAAVARRYGLHAGQLSVWRQQLRRGGAPPEPSGGPAVRKLTAAVFDLVR